MTASIRARLCKNVLGQVQRSKPERKFWVYWLTKHRQILRSNADFKTTPAFLHSLGQKRPFWPINLGGFGQRRVTKIPCRTDTNFGGRQGVLVAKYYYEDDAMLELEPGARCWLVSESLISIKPWDGPRRWHYPVVRDHHASSQSQKNQPRCCQLPTCTLLQVTTPGPRRLDT